MRAKKIYSEQFLYCVVEIHLLEVIVLHRYANHISQTHLGEEEAVVFTSAKPQRFVSLKEERAAHILLGRPGFGDLFFRCK